ncbi:hypothetical protein BC828DRAFT_335780, partial [Blastocladiella britannica]
RINLIGAITIDRVFSSLVTDGTATREVFWRFIWNCVPHMNPFPGPRSVLVLDNCAIH